MARTLDQVLADLPAGRRHSVRRRAKELIAEEFSLRELRKALQLTQTDVASTLGKLDAAVSHYTNAQSIDPSAARYPLFLAQVQIKLNKVDEAKANLLRSGRIDPDQAVVWGTLAELAMRENKPGVAQQHIAKARQIEPGVTEWRLIEARALKRSNKPEEAIKLLGLCSLAPCRQLRIARTPAQRLIAQNQRRRGIVFQQRLIDLGQPTGRTLRLEQQRRLAGTPSATRLKR